MPRIWVCHVVLSENNKHPGHRVLFSCSAVGNAGDRLHCVRTFSYFVIIDAA